MTSRILSIGAIFVATTVAWMILAGTITSRTRSSEEQLSSRVQSIWGTEQVQAAPAVHFDGPGVIAGAAKSEIIVALSLDHRKKGLLWYSTYAVDFRGTYFFSNPGAEARHMRVLFPLPAQQALYDGLEVTLNGQPHPLQIDGNSLAATTLVQPSEQLRFTVKYKSRGLDSWRYSFGDKITEVRDFALRMTTDFRDIDFPDNTLAPGRKTATANGWQLDWNYQSLLSGYQIAMAMPQKLQPGPLAAEISFFAPVSLLFFFFLLFLVTTLQRIELHAMNYCFLAGAFFAFHLLLAYLVDHIDIHLAFGLASAVSIGLVASYLRLVAGSRFAFREAAAGQFVYLVLFSYAFFFRGFTGLAVTVGAIVTLFVAMQATGRIRWGELRPDSVH